jgi:hypothetical protein
LAGLIVQICVRRSWRIFSDCKATVKHRWVNDPDKVMGWMKKYNLRNMIKANGGLVKISNFLPKEVLSSQPDTRRQHYPGTSGSFH